MPADDVYERLERAGEALAPDAAAVTGGTDWQRAGKPGKPRAGRVIQSVDKAVDLLEALSQQDTDLQLKEIAALVGLNISTCHHLLHTLLVRGYVAQDPRTKTYALGNRVFALSSARSRQIDVVRLAMPTLRRLNEETKETVHLAQLQGRELSTLVKLEALHAIRVDIGQIGKSNAAHATATGKAILAWLPEAEVTAIVAEKGMTRFTDKTITTFSELMEQFRLIRRHGYAFDAEEFQPGVVCVGAPIRNHLGATVASIACSTPTMRSSDAQLLHLTQCVKSAAATMSQSLGSS
jgi:IclR family acetate operon transcriptional repressor